jgi:isoleucyl-tRNA synthetase
LFPVLQDNLIVAVDDDGCFIEKITDFSGRYVKDADKDIIEAVKVRLSCAWMKIWQLNYLESDFMM